MGAGAAGLLSSASKTVGNMLTPTGVAGPSDGGPIARLAGTFFAVAGLVGRVRAPAAENIPYIK